MSLLQLSESTLAECHFGLLLTRTSEEGFPLFKEGVVDFFSLLLFGGGRRLQEREGFLLQGI